MKVYICVDIEGVAGICHVDEIGKGRIDYSEFRTLLTKEVLAACEGAFRAGATEITIKDSHWTGRNILLDELPKNVKIIRGWSGHPLCMMQEVNANFDAVAIIGFHSPAGSAGNPLSHTLNGGSISKMFLNGSLTSEFQISLYSAWQYNTPVIFLSGDEALCNNSKELVPNISTVSTFSGIGDSVWSISPAKSQEEIAKGMESALSRDLSEYKIDLPEKFNLEVNYAKHKFAYKAGFYPGAERLDDFSVSIESKNFLDILKFLLFCID